jgi:hypothetical protein
MIFVSYIILVSYPLSEENFIFFATFATGVTDKGSQDKYCGVAKIKMKNRGSHFRLPLFFYRAMINWPVMSLFSSAS